MSFFMFISVNHSCLLGSHCFVPLRYNCVFLIYYITSTKTKKKWNFIQRETLSKISTYIKCIFFVGLNFCTLVSTSSPIYFVCKCSGFATLKINICNQNATYRNLIPTSLRTDCILNININRLALHRAMIGVRRTNHTKHVNKVFRLIPVHNLHYPNFHFNIILTATYTTFKRSQQTPKLRSNYCRCQCLRLSSTLI